MTLVQRRQRFDELCDGEYALIGQERRHVRLRQPFRHGRAQGGFPGDHHCVRRRRCAGYDRHDDRVRTLVQDHLVPLGNVIAVGRTDRRARVADRHGCDGDAGDRIGHAYPVGRRGRRERKIHVAQGQRREPGAPRCADDAGVFAVAAVVYAPPGECAVPEAGRALCPRTGRLGRRAAQVVHPDRAAALAETGPGQNGLRTLVAELPADEVGVVLGPVVIADRAPDAIVVDLDAALGVVRSTDEADVLLPGCRRVSGSGKRVGVAPVVRLRLDTHAVERRDGGHGQKHPATTSRIAAGHRVPAGETYSRTAGAGHVGLHHCQTATTAKVCAYTPTPANCQAFELSISVANRPV